MLTFIMDVLRVKSRSFTNVPCLLLKITLLVTINFLYFLYMFKLVKYNRTHMEVHNLLHCCQSLRGGPNHGHT